MRKLVILLVCLVCCATAGRLGLQKRLWWLQNVGQDKTIERYRVTPLPSLQKRQKFLLDVLLQVHKPLVNAELIQLGNVLIQEPEMYQIPNDEILLKFLVKCSSHDVITRNDVYSDFDYDHAWQIIGLYKFLVLPRTWSTFERNVCFARLHMHPIVFVNALQMAVRERDDTDQLIMPAINEILPHLFYDKNVIATAEEVEWETLADITKTVKPTLWDIVGLRGWGHWWPGTTKIGGWWNSWHDWHMKMLKEKYPYVSKAHVYAHMYSHNWPNVDQKDVDVSDVVTFEEHKIVVPVNEQRNGICRLVDDIGFNIFWNNVIIERMKQTVTSPWKPIVPVSADKWEDIGKWIPTEKWQHSDEWKTTADDNKSDRDEYGRKVQRTDNVPIDKSKHHIWGEPEEIVGEDIVTSERVNELGSWPKTNVPKRDTVTPWWWWTKKVPYDSNDDVISPRPWWWKRSADWNDDSWQKKWVKVPLDWEKVPRNWQEVPEGWVSDNMPVSHWSRVPKNWHQVPKIWKTVPEDWEKVAHNWQKVPLNWQKVPLMWQKVPYTWEVVAKNWLNVPETWKRVPSSWEDVSRTWENVPPTWENVPRDVEPKTWSPKQWPSKNIKLNNWKEPTSTVEEVVVTPTLRRRRNIETVPVSTLEISPVDKIMSSRSGEIFIQNMQELLARINWENLALIDVHEQTEHSLEPELWTSDGVEYKDKALSEIATKQAIKSVVYKLKTVIDGVLERHQIAKNSEKVLDVIGDILISRNGFEGNIWDEMFTHVCQEIYGVVHENVNIPTELSVAATNLREPIYHDIVAELLDLVNDYKENLQPYNIEELTADDVTVQDVVVDNFVTYTELVDSDLINVIDQQLLQSSINNIEKLENKVVVREERLNHQPFTVTYEIVAEKPQRVVVRTFLGPKTDENEDVISLNDNRLNFIQLDAFVENLEVGKNIIERKSREVVWTKRDVSTMSEIYERVMLGQNWNDLVGANCQFPHRLLLPRGTVKGLPVQLLVVVTPVTTEDRVLQQQEIDPEEFCGLGIAAMHLDNLPLGFPLDRVIETTKVIPSILIKDTVIYHV